MKALEGALRGTRILDLTRLAPGPFCSLLLARMGAEVWKVEDPDGGDPLRKLDATAFHRLNSGKKSIALDLKTERGRAALFMLIERADVLLEGYRPGVMARWGLSYEEIAPRFPRLVYLSLTGYGQRGPDRDRAGHDINYMARAGALGSEVPRVQVADFAGGGLVSALAIVAALYQRGATDKGVYLDVSMLEGVRMLMSLATSPAGELLSGAYPCYGVYPTGDGGRLAVGALEPKFWQAFCQGIERPDLAGRGFDRTAREDAAAVLGARPLAEWKDVFSHLDACVEPVLGPEAPLPDAPPPALGEHTAEILAGK